MDVTDYIYDAILNQVPLEQKIICGGVYVLPNGICAKVYSFAAGEKWSKKEYDVLQTLDTDYPQVHFPQPYDHFCLGSGVDLIDRIDPTRLLEDIPFFRMQGYNEREFSNVRQIVADQVKDIWVVTMQYIEGPTWNELTPWGKRKYAKQVIEALENSNKAGVVKTDLKSGEIICAPKRVYFVDAGLVEFGIFQPHYIYQEHITQARSHLGTRTLFRDIRDTLFPDY